MHLDRFVRDLELAAPPGVRVAARVIGERDERALLSEEHRAARSHRLDRLRASGAARIAARAILGDFGHFRVALPSGPTGAPRWPTSVVGSLAHDERIALAAVARSDDYLALGIDVEPAVPLPEDLVDVVTTPRERAWLGGDRLAARALFCAKEAIYKALHPLDGIALDHHDVELDASLRARVRGGREVDVSIVRERHVAAIAFVAAHPMTT